MARKYVMTDDEMRAWKDAEKAGSVDADAVIVKRGGAAIGTGKIDRDTVAKFLAAAPADVKDAAMDAVGAGTERIMVPFCMSDETADRAGDVITASGWKLSEYRKNPVLLWSHDHSTPAIGNGVGVHVDGKSLLAVAQFTSRDVNPLGHMIGRMYEERVLRANSVGFKSLLHAYDDSLGPYGVRFMEQELLEDSACNVGCNPNALTQARSMGIDMDPMIEMIERQLDGEMLLKSTRPELEASWKSLRPGVVFSVGALVKAIDDEQAARIKAEREAARAAPVAPESTIIDWRAVAADLAAKVGAPEFQAAVRARTFHASEKAVVETEAPAVEAAVAALMSTESEVKESPTAPVDTDASAIEDAPVMTAEDFASALTEAAQRLTQGDGQ